MLIKAWMNYFGESQIAKLIEEFCMKVSMLRAVLLLGATFFIVACGSAKKEPKPPIDNPVVGYSACTEPRPEVCTQQYLPVCAKKDTGIRCVTTPCPSTENVTYSNACSACADKKVYGYRTGACEAK